MPNRRIVVGASGASGTPLLAACLEELARHSNIETHLIATHGARLTAEHETPGQWERIASLANVVYDPDQLGERPASGTFATEGMLIVPCSMKTVAGIACGYADNLLLRAADVTIKEHRPLVMAPRETPLSAIHLRNLATLATLPTVHIVAPMMTFYQNPQTVEDMMHPIVAKLLAPFGLQVEKALQWEGTRQ